MPILCVRAILDRYDTIDGDLNDYFNMQPKENQQTVQKSFTVGGVGLHTGEYAFVTVKPAHAGQGRYFVRVPEGTNANAYNAPTPSFVAREQLDINYGAEDGLQPEERAQYFLQYLQEEDFDGGFGDYLREQEIEEVLKDDLLFEPVLDTTIEEPTVRLEGEEWVPANIHVAEIYGETTTILRNGSFYVMSPESILSALEACGIDNARIEIEGGSEVPVGDGSGLTWVLEIQKAGTQDAPAAGDSSTERRAPAPKETISIIGEGGSFISFYPAEESMVSVGVDYMQDAEVLGRQWFTWRTSDSCPEDEYSGHYRWTIAPARAVFPSFETVEELFADGLIQAGPDGCCLIADGDSWCDPNLVRFPTDEAARHATQTLMGIMSLCASPGCRGLPLGHIVAFDPTPELQLEFAKAFSLQSKDYTEECVSD